MKKTTANAPKSWKDIYAVSIKPMLEVGQRYASLHQALKDNNFELASYHWKKIKQTIKNG